MNVFKRLNVYEDYQNCIKLFSNYQENGKINASECVERMTFIQKVYMQWIKTKKSKDNDNIIDIYDVISKQFGDEYSINEFLRDYKYLVHENRNCLPYHDEEDDESINCNINECFIHNRVHRDRGRISRNNNIRTQLFFVNNSNDTENDDDLAKSVFIQDILDGLHQFIYHTLRVRIQKFIKIEPEQKADGGQDDDYAEDDEMTDIAPALFEEGIKEYTKFIENKTASSNRFASNCSTSTTNKFMTLSMDEHQQKQQLQAANDNDNAEELAIYQSQIYQNDQLALKQKKQTMNTPKTLCFIDYLSAAIKISNKLDYKLYDKIEAYLKEQAFDSDAVADDVDGITTKAGSNILTDNLGGDDKAALGDILSSFVYKRGQSGKIYDAGKRFFYWPYYKHIKKEWNVLYEQEYGQSAVEGNAGYFICDWYIDKKYADLREELSQNNIYCFSINQLKDLQIMAKTKLENWIKDPSARKLLSQNKLTEEEAWAEKYYGIKQGETISMEHIMSLLAYTNYTKHSAAFSSTFRRTSVFESDKSFKLRHKEFYHWAKLLRELVECYGQRFDEVADDLSVLYHGVSKSLVFDSTMIKLSGPLSTTAGLFISSILLILSLENRLCIN